MAKTARNLTDGYYRGWGIEYGQLQSEIEADPLYQTALGLSWTRSHMALPKKLNLFLLITKYLRDVENQNIIEFGSYRGGTAMFMAAILKEVCPKAKVFALDTYEGMPPTDLEKDLHKAGDFSDTSYEDVQAAVDSAGLDNLILVKGLFNETFPLLQAQGLKFGLAHIDCDIYDGVKYSQSAVWPQMAQGGYIVYDDPLVSSCIGAMQAIEEMVIERKIHSEQVFPHFVFRV